jgi:hypothetical protein
MDCDVAQRESDRLADAEVIAAMEVDSPAQVQQRSSKKLAVKPVGRDGDRSMMAS